MNEELSQLLTSSSLLIRKELEELTQDVEIKFIEPCNVSIENVYITLISISSNVVTFEIAGNIVTKGIELLEDDQFDILFKIYQLTKASILFGRLDKNSEFLTKGHRKSDK